MARTETVQDRAAQAEIAASEAHIARQARWSRLAIGAERAVRLLWPVWGLIAGFVGLALLGAPQALPMLAHWALLLTLAGALIWLCARALRDWRSPHLGEARARLEAGAPQRPVAALSDVAALGAPKLWAAHRARMARAARGLNARAPDLRVSGLDRFALRHLGALVLAAGLIAQGFGGAGGGVAAALSPQAPGGPPPPPPRLELWASPPAYTGRAPVYLSDRAGERFALPENTRIALRLFDAQTAPVLSGLEAPAPAGDAAAGWRADVELTRDGALEVAADGEVLGRWTFTVISDAPPEIAFTEPPSAALSGALQIPFEASDDYGLVSAGARIALDPQAEPPVAGVAAEPELVAPPAFPLPLPLTGEVARAAETAIRDLTAHPFAGLPVVLTLSATDAAEQEGLVEIRMVLPARPFFEPLARALVEQRRDLVWSRALAPRVHDVLQAITAYPEDIFEDDVAYLTVRAAIRRLGYALDQGRVAQEAESVAELLWRAALRIEDGDLSDAERRLRELQQRLSEALERNAPPEELSELMRNLREALNEFMRQLAQEAMRDQQRGQAPPPQDGQSLSQEDLQRMLDRLEDALSGGMREQARQMLSDLAQMLENLQMAQPGQGQGQGQGMGQGGVQPLQEMIGRQQGLADQSFDALRRGAGEGAGQGRDQQGGEGQGRGGQSGEGLSGLARDQEGLRRDLEGLRGQGGPQGEGVDEALERADRAMEGAREALERGDADAALQQQAEALDALREGARAAAQAQAGEGAPGGREGPGRDSASEDPFGRPGASDGPVDGQSVRVPEGAGASRARELMDEIRRRAGERARPEFERDYLERLIDRF